MHATKYTNSYFNLMKILIEYIYKDCIFLYFFYKKD